MLKADAIKYYGTVRRLADAVDLGYSAVRMWPEVVPRGAACELEVITAGALRVDWSLYPPRRRRTEGAAQ